MFFGKIRISWEYRCMNPIFSQIMVIGKTDYQLLKKFLHFAQATSDETIYEELKKFMLANAVAIIDKATTYESILISVENWLEMVAQKDFVEVAFGLQFKNQECLQKFLKSVVENK